MSDLFSLLTQLELPKGGLRGAMDDSRQVLPGDLFLAYPGHGADGRQYIADALSKGARGVFWEPGNGFAWHADWLVPNQPVSGLRALAGPLAHELSGRPSDVLNLLAVTGTNGKTTISQWLAQVYPGRCGVIGTLGAGFPGREVSTGFTTPEATTLARFLAGFLAQGARACALEASSIGIEEGRMNGFRVDTAIFTNFTRDHLDYHGTMAAYGDAKEKLFCWPGLRLAVINLDDPFGPRLVCNTTAPQVMGYSLETGNKAAQIRAENIRDVASGQNFRLQTPRGQAEVRSALVGRYNLSNLLAVAAVLLDQGLEVAAIATCLSRLAPPPGRMERYGGVGEPLVAVDYAHTPDALSNALSALRSVAVARGGRLICIFGCGGERDRGKRPVMGQVAVDLADQVWLTNDNPRSEDPWGILEDIQKGAPGARVEPDRRAAIELALVQADAGDVLLVAGKGHESYQDIAGVRHPFSDGEQVRRALAVRKQNREVA